MSDQIQTEKPANPFLPIALIAISIISLIGPQTLEARKVKASMLDARSQMEKTLADSQPTMQRFDKMMRDLLLLAQTDADAKQLTVKYGIAVQQPQAPQR